MSPLRERFRVKSRVVDDEGVSFGVDDEGVYDDGVSSQMTSLKSASRQSGS